MEWTKGRKWALLAAALSGAFVTGTALGVFVGIGIVHTYSVDAQVENVAPVYNGTTYPGFKIVFCNPHDEVVSGGFNLLWPHVGAIAPIKPSDEAPLIIDSSAPYVLTNDSGPYRAGQQGWALGWWWAGNTTPEFIIDVWAVCQT